MPNLHTTLIHAAQSPAHWDAARALLKAYGPEFIAYGRQAGHESEMDWFEHEMSDLPAVYPTPDHALLIAWRGESAIGMIGLHRDQDPLSCELKRLFVLPAYRGRGVGKALVQASMSAARDMKCRRIFLATWASMQTAIALYERLGFQHFQWPSTGAAWENHAAFLERALGAIIR